MKNYQEHIRTTDDIEFLRTELLKSQEFNNRLHRRVQEYESIAAQWKVDEAVLNSANKLANEHYNRFYTKHRQLWKAICALPFPLEWFVVRHIEKELNKK